jgi:hypothetical protein
LCTVLSLLALSVIINLFLYYDRSRTFLFLYVFLAGLIGGFVSIQQRLPRLGPSELQGLSKSWISILVMPINGGIFALVLMLMFLSGIVEGTLFPKYFHPPISHKDDFINSFRSWLIAAFPDTGPDVGKLLFWSFVAGFCERFVPQIIRKTAADARADDESGGAGQRDGRTAGRQ